MDKKVMNFVEAIKKALGNNLKSFVIYGSAAAGEHYAHSDYNTLMVVESLDTVVLKSVSGAVKKWVSMGQPVPLMFTMKSIMSSSDVFPMEFFDIKENCVVLSGEDVFKKVKVNPKNLRLEVERELKSKFIRLCQSYAAGSGRPRDVRLLLVRSVSSFAAILKGVIRLYKKKPPVKKADIINAAPTALKLNKGLFLKVLAMKDGSVKVSDHETMEIFKEYLKEIERLALIIDKK